MKFSTILAKEQHYRLIVVGGGTGGCAIASKISRLLPPKQKQIAIIEPNTAFLSTRINFTRFWTNETFSISKK
uniref:Uncharacterized protein n=1 Tax=Meloidogyne floridensis TaxID=298350 RepID=A0A915P0P1_9BILA